MERKDLSSFALCGNAGSGKDLAFTIMKYIIVSDMHLVPKLPIASGTELIAFSKDDQWLMDKLYLRVDRFAAPIKACIASFINVEQEWLNVPEVKTKLMSNEFFTQDKPAVTIREAHQIIGDALKQAFNQDIFALSLVSRVADSDMPTAVLDLRYPNEAAVLKVNGIKIIKIVKDNQGQLMQHSSEQHINEIDADFVLHNDGKSVKNFASNILRMLKEFEWVSQDLSIHDLIRDF